MKKIIKKILTLKNQNTQSNLKEMSILLSEEEVRKRIDFYLHSDELSTEELEELKALVESAQYVYENSGYETGMSDTEYDILFEKLNTLNAIGITSTVSIGGDDIVHHKYRSLRGTLDKVYALTEEEVLKNDSRKTLDEWIKTSENKIKEKTGSMIDLNSKEVYCFPKFDGVSVVFHFSKTGRLLKALTRGNTETNEAKDVTHIFRGWVEGPYDNSNLEYGLKTEVMMTNEDFEKYNETHGTNYKQSRSIVSSIINSKEADERIRYLKVIPLRVSYMNDNEEESLQELPPGVFTYPYLRCQMSDRDKMMEFAMNNRLVNGLRTDGMVIYLIDKNIQKILGRENEKQKFEVAYKFTEEKSYSKIKDIIFTTGLYGILHPIAIIQPIEMKGNEINRISLGSFQRFLDLRLAKGDTVQVLYDIIPYLVFDENDPKCKRSGKDPIERPEYCPDCGKRLEISISNTNANLVCRNDDCPCKKKGRILNYVNKMDIANISYATIELFYDLGYLEKIEDLYLLEGKKKELSKLPGFGKKSIQAILDEINNHRVVSESKFLGSLGILGVSTKTFQKVLEMLSFDELLEFCYQDESVAVNVLCVIPGIKEKTAKKIIEGLKENEETIEFLEQELELEQDISTKNSKFRVVFTKVRNEKLEEFIAGHGGVVDNTVKKDTDLLIVPVYGVESAKVNKAKKYNIPIIGIDEAEEFITTEFLQKSRFVK